MEKTKKKLTVADRKRKAELERTLREFYKRLTPVGRIFFAESFSVDKNNKIK